MASNLSVQKFEKNVLKTYTRLETSRLSSLVNLLKKHSSLLPKSVAQQTTFQHFFIGLVSLSLANSILLTSIDSVQST